MGTKSTSGKPTQRRYSPEEKARAVRLVRQLRKELGTSHGTVQRVADQIGCGVDANGEPIRSDLDAILRGTGASIGGKFLVSARSELRFAMTSALDGGVFVDAGNLWQELANVDLTQLRYAVGGGVRFPLPIGPAAFDLAVNTNPDSVLNEPLWRIHLSIGAF